MQGVGSDNQGILVLGASNVPWELDPAARRRFEKRIYIPLPDLYARKILFQNKLGKTPHNMSDEDFMELAEATEGYSGSDIAIVVKEAMMMPVRKCKAATKFKMTKDGMWEPTYPSDTDGVEMTIFQIGDPTKLKAPDVTCEDFF